MVVIEQILLMMVLNQSFLEYENMDDVHFNL
jgi:hypothetical protein